MASLFRARGPKKVWVSHIAPKRALKKMTKFGHFWLILSQKGVSKALLPQKPLFSKSELKTHFLKMEWKISLKCLPHMNLEKVLKMHWFHKFMWGKHLVNSSLIFMGYPLWKCAFSCKNAHFHLLGAKPPKKWGVSVMTHFAQKCKKMHEKVQKLHKSAHFRKCRNGHSGSHVPHTPTHTPERGASFRARRNR